MRTHTILKNVARVAFVALLVLPVVAAASDAPAVQVDDEAAALAASPDDGTAPAPAVEEPEVQPDLEVQDLTVVEPDFTPSPDLEAEPMAICRMAPQCETNSDCDALCGTGQGRCGHSRCPRRVCVCR